MNRRARQANCTPNRNGAAKCRYFGDSVKVNGRVGSSCFLVHLEGVCKVPTLALHFTIQLKPPIDIFVFMQIFESGKIVVIMNESPESSLLDFYFKC